MRFCGTSVFDKINESEVTVSHSPSCKLRKTELFNYQIWNDEEDGLFIFRNDSRIADEAPGSTFVGQFLSTDELSACLKAFGTLPEIDKKILPLVLAINDIPGVGTKYSCMGHSEKGDREGYIMFTVRNIKILRNLGRWLTQIETPSLYEPWDDDYPDGSPPGTDPILPMHMALEYVLNGSNDRGDELTMTFRFTKPNRVLPPSGAAYNWLADQIRARLAAHGCTCERHRLPLFAGEYLLREKCPTSRAILRFKRAKDIARMPSALAHSAWTSKTLLVQSSIVRLAKGRLFYRLNIADSERSPEDAVCRDVLEVFQMQGATESRIQKAGPVRHFERSLDAVVS